MKKSNDAAIIGEERKEEEDYEDSDNIGLLEGFEDEF